jgi:hypothetical protein
LGRHRDIQGAGSAERGIYNVGRTATGIYNVCFDIKIYIYNEGFWTATEKYNKGLGRKQKCKDGTAWAETEICRIRH